jgi:hypothetical protein
MFLYLYTDIFRQNVNAEYNSENCEKETIESVLSEYNNSNFLFVSFLHGDQDAMYVSNEKIVSSDNAYFFSNAFCYTFSCYCGKELASVLIENQALVFWGYIDKAFTILDYEEDFAELAISGLKHFMKNETVNSAFNKVKEEYTNKIDAIYQENFFVAATLLHNKESMVIYGNKSITVSDLIRSK